MNGDDSTFRQLFGKSRHPQESGTGSEDNDGSSDLTGPDFSAPYKPAGASRGKGLTSLWVYFNAEERKQHKRRKRQFQFRNLDDDDADSGFLDDGTGFSLVFSGQKRHRLIVKGRGGPKLEEIYDRITLHRTPWIRSLDPGRDFGADGEAVITSIRIELLQDEEIQGFTQLK